MGQSLNIPGVIPNDWKRLGLIINKIKFRLGRGSNPTLTGLTLSGLTASRLVATDPSKVLESSNLASWMTQTANQVLVADDGDGTITLSTPQDIHTGASPQFVGLELGHASDTTITRVSAGIIAVEGTTVMMVGDTPTSHIIASHSDTSGTGAELNELTDGSETTLHSHASGGSLIGAIHDCGSSDVSVDEDISFGGGYSL